LREDECTFYISDETLEKIETDALWKFEDEHLLFDAIKGKPACVAFLGLGRDGHRKSYCYAIKLPNPPQKGLFLVYIMDGPPGTFSGPVVMGWDWRDEDKDTPGFPDGWEKDFGVTLWQKP